MPTILERCYEFHTVNAKVFNSAVVFELAEKLGVTIIFEPEDLPDPDDETLNTFNLRLYTYHVEGSDLKLVIGYDGIDHTACGRLHTFPYLEHANGVIKDYVDSPYFCPERYCQRVGEILGVFEEPRSNWSYHPFFNQ